jgi:uncharacterized RDD family membrane protein YckC
VPAEPGGPASGLRFAPHGPRFVAYLVDVGLLLGITLIGILVATAVGVAGVAFLVLFVVTLAYFPWFWARGGATPGMRVFKLRLVRDQDGGPVGWGAALLRLVGFWVSGLVFYLGFAWILIDSRRRGWHDLLAGTVMVQPI